MKIFLGIYIAVSLVIAIRFAYVLLTKDEVPWQGSCNVFRQKGEWCHCRHCREAWIESQIGFILVWPYAFPCFIYYKIKEKFRRK